MAGSILGHQAPLGFQGPGPAQLRNETSPNNGGRALRQGTLGNVVVQRAPAAGLGTDPLDPSDGPPVEGANDVARIVSPPSRAPSNGRTTSRNRHAADFQAGSNDPSSRFSTIEGGFVAVERMINAISLSLQDTSPARHRTYAEIAEDFMKVSALVDQASDKSRKAFLTSMLKGIEAEGLAALGAQNHASSSDSAEDGNGE